jgi:hypothetical protein
MVTNTKNNNNNNKTSTLVTTKIYNSQLGSAVTSQWSSLTKQPRSGSPSLATNDKFFFVLLFFFSVRGLHGPLLPKGLFLGGGGVAWGYAY